MTEKLKAANDEVAQERDVRVVHRSMIALARYLPVDVTKSLRTIAIKVEDYYYYLLEIMHCARNLTSLNLFPRINCGLLANEKTDDDYNV